MTTDATTGREPRAAWEAPRIVELDAARSTETGTCMNFAEGYVYDGACGLFYGNS